MFERFTTTNRIRKQRFPRILAPPLIGLAIIALIAAACSSDDPQQQDAATEVEQQQQQEVQYQQQVQQQAMQQQAQQQSVEYDRSQQEVEYQQAQQQAQEASMQEAEEQESRSSSSQESSSQSQRESASYTPSAVNFEDYPTTGWQLSERDDTSSFSLDVDRTSYFLALNWVNNGYSIAPQSVRAEEWINAFNYQYELPRNDDTFAIHTDVVEHPLHPDLHLARVAMQAPEFRDNTPLNVTLVLDASGSMAEGNRVEIAREAAEAIRRGLNRDDRLAVVLFSESVVDEIGHRQPDDDRVTRVIDNLYPRGSTNVQAGLNLAVEHADDARRDRPDAYNYVILMSDGVANVDATDPFRILATAEDRNERNPLRLITVGVGIHNYNDVLLEQLAQYGNGWYRYLSDVGDARQTFSRENWLALSIPFADQARAQVRWNDDQVVAWRLVGYENRVTSDRAFQQDRKEFAEVPMGTATTAFFEIELAPDVSGDIELGELELRYVTVPEGRSATQIQTLEAAVSRLGDDQHLDLGALVALAADRYSWFGQGGLSEATFNQAANELVELQDWYRALDQDFQASQPGRDLRLLLNSMVQAAEPHITSDDPGYSR